MLKTDTMSAGGTSNGFGPWLMNKLLMGKSWPDYARSLATPFNVMAVAILIASVPAFFSRYTQGLSTVVHASTEYPWGLLLSWGIFAGEPLYACGFLAATAYYVLGYKEFKPLVRLGVMAGMLGYMFAASYLLIDLGRPWRLYYPMAVGFGPSSVLFIVAWHVALYVNVQLLEFTPAILEWLGSKRIHKWVVSATVGLVILGTVLTTIHQSALGAMYLITPHKLHPLWYSSYLPIFFLSSAMYAAMAFLVMLMAVSVKYFRHMCDSAFINSVKRNTISLGKGIALAMYVYFALKVIGLAKDGLWGHLATPYGYWYLLEVAGLLLLPAMLMTYGVKKASLFAIRAASVWAMLGIVLNRVNVNLIAYNWFMPDHFKHITPPMPETLMILSMITLQLMVMRWILNRMPVLGQEPGYEETH